jgi:hypothetical protein
VAGIALQRSRDGSAAATAAWCLAGALPLVGLVSLLARAQLDPGWENPGAHFALFLTVGGTPAVLAFAAGEAARRRGDARVLLLSLAFLATGGFMALHALGTRGVLVTTEYAGFKIAIPVGLLIASGFIAAAALVDLRAGLAGLVVRHRGALRGLVLAAMALWVLWTLARLPPLRQPSSEGSTHSALAVMAALGVAVYGAAAVRLWLAFRGRMTLLPASVVACCVLLAEALVGVASTGERSWHASWWSGTLSSSSPSRSSGSRRRASGGRSASAPCTWRPRGSGRSSSACSSVTSPASPRSPSAPRRRRWRGCSRRSTGRRRRPRGASAGRSSA